MLKGSMSSIEMIATIIGSIFGSQALTALVNQWATKKKISADADTQTTDNALKWAEALTMRINKLEGALEIMRKENLELYREVAGLRVKVDFYEKGMVPISTPMAIPPQSPPGSTTTVTNTTSTTTPPG